MASLTATLTPAQLAHRREYGATWQRAYRKGPAGRARVRKNNLAPKGLTPEGYAAMLNAQGGVCGACGKPETGRNQHGVVHLAVDHDHACHPSGQACTACHRGLLCLRCNRALGLLGDSVQTVAGLLTYRKRFS